MANITILSGYPIDEETKKVYMLDYIGPASYVNTGTFSTSGDPLTAAQLGAGGIEMVDDCFSIDGLYYVKAALGSFNSGGALQTSVNLHWVTPAGTEAANTTNLSTKQMRLRVTCI